MNIVEIKQELDSLYSRVNPPYGVVPEWHEPAVTDEEIAAVEERLGVSLPAEVKEVCKVFSGITDYTPYFMGEQFRAFQDKAAQIIGQEEADMLEDDVEIGTIYPLTEWGVYDEDSWNPKEESYFEIIDEYEQARAEGEAGEYDNVVAHIDCEEGIISDNLFVHIGDYNYGSVFICLNPASKNFGAIYNVFDCKSHVYLMVYKIADNYLDLIERLKKSLEIQLQSDNK